MTVVAVGAAAAASAVDAGDQAVAFVGGHPDWIRLFRADGDGAAFDAAWPGGADGTPRPGPTRR